MKPYYLIAGLLLLISQSGCTYYRFLTYGVWHGQPLILSVEQIEPTESTSDDARGQNADR